MDSRALFYLENQGVSIWAADIDEADPAVWSREQEPGARWEREGEPLSRFLLQVILFEAILGAPEGASGSWLNSAQLHDALRPLHRLSLAPWLWPGSLGHFYAGEGILAFISPNHSAADPEPSDAYTLFLGSRQHGPLTYLRRFVDESWDYYSPRDGSQVLLS